MSKEQIVLKLQDLSIAYGSEPAVCDVTLDVKAGEFFGLIGVNGAGKTTMIKAILGLRGADSGKIEILGQDIAQSTTSKAVAFLPERFEPSWFLSGMEFLHFSTKLYGRRFSDNDFKQYAERLALDPDALKRRVQTFSKGMRQKLGLLATVMTKAEILILDEPMSGLDPVARARVKDLLLDVKKEGRTIFLSSHILADMDEICDRIALLHNKRICYTGAPKGLKEQTGTKNLERAFLQFVEKKAVA